MLDQELDDSEEEDAELSDMLEAELTDDCDDD